jgi:hypothetical protein
MSLIDELCDRYVAVWNESDPERRRELVADLWAVDAEHVLVPPRDVVDAASGLSMRAAFEVRGRQELEARVREAHERFIASGDYAFRRRDDAQRLRDVVKFTWEMTATADGSVAGAGLEFLVVDADGRIRSDYQFIEG